ncbi:uncharacterized protein [Bactrocera oleae]|uniref:uncharacterized protein n=1 Tax=Bactrocera oleae TaxID=104688 RepID=UPI00387EC80B
MKSQKICTRNIHFCSIQLTVNICTILATMLLQHVAAATEFVSHKDCNNAPKGTIIANPVNCSQYIICNGLRSTLGECPANKYFNPNVLSCDKTFLACSGKNIITTVSPTTTATKVTEAEESSTFTLLLITRRLLNTYQRPLGNKGPGSIAFILSLSLALSPAYGRPVCISWYDQQFPHANNCEYYFQCVSGFLSVRRCYFGFGWDLNRQQCVPMQQAHCFRPKLVR